MNNKTRVYTLDFLTPLDQKILHSLVHQAQKNVQQFQILFKVRFGYAADLFFEDQISPERRALVIPVN